MSAGPDPPGERSVPRGRHAPPREIRRATQRARLFEAASTVFARTGYSDATAEAIAREAAMSKATFYEHFANKEECILALFDEAAAIVLRQTTAPLDGSAFESYRERVHAGVRAFLETVAAFPEASQTLLVETIGAGPRAAERRQQVMRAFADFLYDDNARSAPGHGMPTYASKDDAYAVVGAIVELVSRHLRTGEPADPLDLEPVIERAIFGIVSQGTPTPA